MSQQAIFRRPKSGALISAIDPNNLPVSEMISSEGRGPGPRDSFPTESLQYGGSGKNATPSPFRHLVDLDLHHTAVLAPDLSFLRIVVLTPADPAHHQHLSGASTSRLRGPLARRAVFHRDLKKKDVPRVS